MSEPPTGDVGTELDPDGTVLTVTFRRAGRRNALTWEMYEALLAACERADAEDTVRVLVVRGAGGTAFVAGTEISQFRGFTGADGVEYEHRVTRVLNRIRAVRVPTVAAVEGFCVGGGLGIACAADVRIATHGSRFGVPVARTLGNCLSAGTLALMVETFGRPLTLDLLLTARLMETDEAGRVPGFLHAVVDDLDEGLAALVGQLTSHAPLTLWATKELLRPADEVDEAAVVSRVYGSADFADGVAAFAERRSPRWTGA